MAWESGAQTDDTSWPKNTYAVLLDYRFNNESNAIPFTKFNAVRLLMYRYSGHALLLVLGALFVFHSPFTRWWSEQGLPWYTVFVLWLVLIVLIAIDNALSGRAGESGRTGESGRAGESSSAGKSGAVGGNTAGGDSISQSTKISLTRDNTKYPGDTNGD